MDDTIQVKKKGHVIMCLMKHSHYRHSQNFFLSGQLLSKAYSKGISVITEVLKQLLKRNEFVKHGV